MNAIVYQCIIREHFEEKFFIPANIGRVGNSWNVQGNQNNCNQMGNI